MLALALLMACGKPRAVSPSVASGCVVRGTFPIAPSSTLVMGSVPRVRFRGIAVDVEATLNGSGRVVAIVRAFGFRFGGLLDARDVPVRSTRQLWIVRDHLWIESGAPLRVLPGNRVTTTYSEGLNDVVAPVTCEDLALTEKSSSGPHTHTDSPYHLAGKTFALYAKPNGPLIRTLQPESASVFTMWGDRVEQGYVHVLHRDWISFDGWVKQSELAPGEGADCDDCRGNVMDVEDMCPGDDGGGDADGCPEEKRPIAHIQPTDILDDNGNVIGAIESRAEAYVLERKAGRARVIMPSPPILPVGTGWWVAESAIASP